MNNKGYNVHWKEYQKKKYPQCTITQIRIKSYVFLLLGVSGVCRSTTLGKEYTGTLAVTREGKTCQAWSSQYPHSHTRNNPASFPDADLDEASNYCRNPDNESKGPWCYTTDSSARWEFCDVPFCEPTLGKIFYNLQTDEKLLLVKVLQSLQILTLATRETT